MSKICLHLGCGGNGREHVYAPFREEEYEHIRIDADENAKPDAVDDIVTLKTIQDNTVDAVFLSHTLEHVEWSDMWRAVSTFKRVLKPFGQLVLIVPDLQSAAEFVAKDQMFATVYVSAAGPITAYDMFYGFRGMTAGNQFMQHKGGFTKSSLEAILMDSGFMDVKTIRDMGGYNLWGYARKAP